MLNNIKINAGLYTEKAGTGRHINIVLAAGEIEARVRMSNGETFQTTLISGMSFEVPRGFVAVAFTSDVSQQTKVWLSDLPLTYSSQDSRVVGSSAVESYSKKVMFSTPTELLSAKAGRGKSLISASEDIKIGGVGVSPSSAVNIPANVPFEISTQGALFAYSENPANAGSVVVSIGDTGFKTSESGVVAQTGQMVYAERDSEFLIISGGTINRYKAADFSFIQSINVGVHGTFPPYDNMNSPMQKSGDDYYSFVSKNGSTSLIKYDSKTKGFTEVNVAATGGEVEDFKVDTANNRSCVLVVLSSGVRELHFGTLDSWSVYAVPDFGSFDATILSMFGADYIGVYGLQNMIESLDGGVSFSAVKPIGFNLSTVVLEDKQTGFFYTKTNTNLIKRSTDGIVFGDLYQATFNIYSLYVAGGYIYGVGEGGFVYSDDGGETFTNYTFESITGDANKNTLYSVDTSPDGFVYVLDYGSSTVYRLGGESVPVGGLDVAILSEVN